MRSKGFVRAKNNLGLCEAILEKHKIIPEKDGDCLYFDLEGESFFYNRTKAEVIIQELKDAGAEGEILAYSLVEIYKYTTHGDNHD